MKTYQSIDPVKMEQYNILLNLARDKNSTFYNKDGSQNVGAFHRSIFWRGFNGTYTGKFAGMAPSPSSMTYCMWRAGIDFKNEQK